MWTADNRPRYNRDKLRYPSDLTDAESGAYRAADPAGQARRRQTALGRYPQYNEVIFRRDVHSQHRLPVARAAQGFAPAQNGTVHDYLGLMELGLSA